MYSKRYVTHKTCRSCGSLVESVYSLGNFSINEFLDSPGKGEKCFLELVKCVQCGLLQLKHTVNPKKLFSSQYWYRSSVNPVIEKDLKDIAQYYKKGGVWIDVGSNDGTLLKYVSRKYTRIGVEPAKNLAKELKRNCDIVITEFWENYSLIKADIITAFGMLYDSENPNLFVKKVKEYLKPKGIFVAQIMMLKSMLELNDVSNICHEHLEYYSYHSLMKLFERNGLEIFKIKENKMNGGSYRIFSRHFRKGSITYKEPKPDYEKFVRNIKNSKEETVNFIKKVTTEGKKVYGYGASTKGNTILQWYGLNNKFIEGIADRNKKKWGKYTVATNIPIVSEKEGRKKADYFFILPYGFTNYFIGRERIWQEKGGKFIVSIPRFRVF